MPNNEKPKIVVEKQLAGDSDALSVIGRAGANERNRRQAFKRDIDKLAGELSNIELALAISEASDTFITPDGDVKPIGDSTNPDELRQLRYRHNELVDMIQTKTEDERQRIEAMEEKRVQRD